MTLMQPETNFSVSTLPDLLTTTGQAMIQLDHYLNRAKQVIREAVADGDKISGKKFAQEQYAAHGLAWLGTYVEALRQVDRWARNLQQDGLFGELEQLLTQAAFGEYINHIAHGIPMSQMEIVRPVDMLLTEADVADLQQGAAHLLAQRGNSTQTRQRIAELILENPQASIFGCSGLDEDMEMFRTQMQRFVDDKVAPYAHEWHLKDELIPIEVIDELSELGVFGLTIPEEYGGLGLSKMSMCVVSEELSRGYIGVGSLGTRTEIAGELILCGGTEEQKQRWLPKLASGEILPTAVFTEPNTGSDLASLKTRAEKVDGGYAVFGSKTWITHAARTDMMTMLVRTNPDEQGYRGLSMLMGEKPRGDCANPFPAEGMTGGEIHVLGYRGMKEYELSFDNFYVAEENLLGGVEGQGFKQLMATFEGARIQTAARAVGVAQCAMDLSLRYAEERTQFGSKLQAFPRIWSKIAMMAVETMVARQITYFSAREKDAGRRCDLEAGMAKLLAARVAWACADNGLQIHGGNGFALEYPISRVLCDARILNIFEGAAEIQATVVARRILETRN
ncbi:MAG: acyl-CoA dehydrogenase [Alphaproteobacteria bacterium]|nr:acyl-CoA dehydrogenase [Alphaproteobacteria bacterium]